MSAPRPEPPRAEAGPSGLTLRAAAPADAEGIAALFADVFRRGCSADRVRWKLFETPAAVAQPSFVALCDGRVVGQYAATPTRFWAGGRERVGLHGCDVMTAPSFRRRGVLTSLGERAHAEWRGAGLAFVTGLANAAWGTRSAALGWVEVFPLRWMVALLAPERVAALRTGVPALARLKGAGRAWSALATFRAERDRSVSVEAAASAGPELDELWEACRGTLDLSVVRDRAWVDWRYVRAPGTPYRLLVARRGGRAVGYAVFTITDAERGHGVLAELFAARGDEGARAELLRAASGALRDAGAVRVSTLALPGSTEARSLLRAGFFPRARYMFEVVPLAADVPVETLSSPALWMLAPGDFDVV